MEGAPQEAGCPDSSSCSIASCSAASASSSARRGGSPRASSEEPPAPDAFDAGWREPEEVVALVALFVPSLLSLLSLLLSAIVAGCLRLLLREGGEGAAFDELDGPARALRSERECAVRQEEQERRACGVWWENACARGKARGACAWSFRWGAHRFGGAGGGATGSFSSARLLRVLELREYARETNGERNVRREQQQQNIKPSADEVAARRKKQQAGVAARRQLHGARHGGFE